MTPQGRLARLGFDPARLGFALRTALTACAALLAAWLMGLEHPQWAAMTVWAASQPTRAMLLEKSFFRAAGTVVGVVAGVLLIGLSGGQPALLVLGLAAWIGLCVGAGNTLRGFVAYGTILAGYSAAMVALLSTAHPGAILALGVDRLLTVLVGVLAGTLVGFIFLPATPDDPVVGQARRLTARLLRDMAARLAGRNEGLEEEQRAILSQMAAIDEALDPHGAGSLRSRRSARSIRAVLAAQVSALLWLRGAATVPIDAAASQALEEAASAQDALAPAEAVIGPLERAARLLADHDADHGADHRALGGVLAELHAALRGRLDGRARGWKRDPSDDPAARPVILHRDWVGARHAAIRAAGTLLLVGAAWVLSGWSGGAFVLLGLSVMISLFSTAENPARIMRAIQIGQAFGAAAALACRWLVWPLAGSGLDLVLLVMPFILLGALPVAHRRTMAGAYDYNLVLLLLLQPAYPLAGAFAHSLALALAVVAGPLLALVAFRLAFPADARRRMETLMAMMVHDLQDMAADADAPRRRAIWRARLHHRLLRLVRWAEKAGEGDLSAADGSLAVMQTGAAILRLRELRRAADRPAGCARAIDAAL
ncbi:MAG: FUSC family protein, partial [Rhodospirillales bacterium]|nr:FUSC family protein [Rhodospirillales bacterium]